MQVNGTQQCRQSPATSNSPKPVTNRAKRKSRWKLKFHHQALPPEYLDHYEASLQQQCNKAKPPPPQVPAPRSMAICSTLKSLESATVSSPTSCRETVPTQLPCLSTSQQSTVRYKDLPYMGEMTLDNARPRRGRKPKKADICHLIYKNYGTTVVDEPLNLCLRDLQNKETSNDVSMCKFKFTAGVTPSLEEKKTISLNPRANYDNNNHASIVTSDEDNNNDNNTINDNRNNNNNNSSSSSSGNLKLFETNRIRNKEIKRKTRKSLAREKLEKTFKERGFLIQTQQLESAQGATYCKFRQLRKFTRYLFRSWKHHLPGDVVNTNSV